MRSGRARGWLIRYRRTRGWLSRHDDGESRRLGWLVDRARNEQDERHDRDGHEPDARPQARDVQSGAPARGGRISKVSPQLR